jgi:hypothetical protein
MRGNLFLQWLLQSEGNGTNANWFKSASFAWVDNDFTTSPHGPHPRSNRGSIGQLASLFNLHGSAKAKVQCQFGVSGFPGSARLAPPLTDSRPFAHDFVFGRGRRYAKAEDRDSRTEEIRRIAETAQPT